MTIGPLVDYADWLMSDRFQPLVKEHESIGAANASLLRVRLEETCPVPPTQNFTIQLMTQGRMAYRGDFGAGRFAGDMRTGHFGFAGPDVPLFNEGRGRMEFLVLSLPADHVRGRWAELLEGRQPDLQRLHTTLNQDEQVATLLPWLWREAQASGPGGRMYADAVIEALLYHIARLAEAQPQFHRGGLAPWQVRRVSDYLEDHLAEDVTLAELGALLGLSTFHLCRAFKQSTGLPPHRWRQQRRMERGRELLEGTNFSITEIAAAVGYDDPSRFAAGFRKAFGLSPSDYRRERRS